MTDNRFRITDEKLNSLRNRAELPLYFICVLINVSVISAVVISFVYFDFVGIAYYIAFGYLFVNLFLTLGSMLSVTRLYSVRISGEQFPDVYKVACEYSEILGFKKVPEIYVKQNGGIINAFASNFFCTIPVSLASHPPQSSSNFCPVKQVLFPFCFILCM